MPFLEYLNIRGCKKIPRKNASTLPLKNFSADILSLTFCYSLFMFVGYYDFWIIKFFVVRLLNRNFVCLKLQSLCTVKYCSMHLWIQICVFPFIWFKKYSLGSGFWKCSIIFLRFEDQ